MWDNSGTEHKKNCLALKETLTTGCNKRAKGRQHKNAPPIFRFWVVHLLREFQSHHVLWFLRFCSFIIVFCFLLEIKKALYAWLVLKSIGNTCSLVCVMCEILLCWDEMERMESITALPNLCSPTQKCDLSYWSTELWMQILFPTITSYQLIADTPCLSQLSKAQLEKANNIRCSS